MVCEYIFTPFLRGMECNGDKDNKVGSKSMRDVCDVLPGRKHGYFAGFVKVDVHTAAVPKPQVSL
jgi:hypothetical protein